MTKIEQIALAIYDKLISAGGESRWEDLTEEERQDALEWARSAMIAARERSAELVIACADLFGSQTEIWETSIDAILGNVPPGRIVH
ncbi:MAG TPA: hypothetical protein VGC56_07360 [Allosphingosinicella sp.]|jgi:hypothetical protein